MVELCRAESASVADSADNVDVVMKLHHVNEEQPLVGSLIPSYESI